MTAPIVRRSPVHAATVVDSVRLGPRMQRVTVRADSLVGVGIRPAQDVELHLRDETGRRVKRRYTIRHHRPDSGEIDLDVVLHGAGPGAVWGASATAGDTVEFQGPRGKLELRPAAHHLLIGDEAALPAIATIAEAVPAGEQVTAVVEVQDAADELPLAGNVHWVHREDAPAGGAELLLGALAGVRPAAEGLRAYLLGETRAMVALRGALEDRGIDHDAIFVKGYWNLGRLSGRAAR